MLPVDEAEVVLPPEVKNYLEYSTIKYRDYCTLQLDGLVECDDLTCNCLQSQLQPGQFVGEQQREEELLLAQVSVDISVLAHSQSPPLNLIVQSAQGGLESFILEEIEGSLAQ